MKRFAAWLLAACLACGITSAAMADNSYVGTITAGETVTAETEKAWYANNKVKLNECASGTGESAANWTVKVTPGAPTSAASAGITYKAEVTAGGCQSLTPNFTAIDGTID